MKNVLKTTIGLVLMASAFSCTKEDNAGEELNCYVCSVNARSLDVCIKDDGDFLVDGDTVPNPNGASLEDYIATIEANPGNDPELEGISCERK